MKQILSDITPTSGEVRALNKAAKHFIKKLNKKLIYSKAVLGGSVAKKTFLKGSHDIDIFVQFDKEKYKNKDISDILHRKLKSLYKNTEKISGIQKIHGSRDYYQIIQDPFVFEIIPILKIKKSEHAENITDVSPLHTKWVKKNAKQLTGEIRLAKSFCKANNLYGAESYIRGFSGYVLELLITQHKSFINLMKAASQWNSGIVIDPGNHTAVHLDKSKLSPLILIDPVQKNRNAAAALSEKKFNEFISLAKKFLRNPSQDLFIKKDFNLDEIKSAAVLRISSLEGKKDIVGAKLIKVMEYIKRRLSEEGFEVKSNDWHWDNNGVYFWYFTKSKILPLEKKHYGPPIKENKNLQTFKRKYSHYPIKTEGSRTYVLLKRKHTHINTFLKELITDSYIKEKVKTISLLS